MREKEEIAAMRTVKREPAATPSGVSRGRVAENHNENAAQAGNCKNSVNNGRHGDGEVEEDFVGRRVLRSRYLNVKIRISDERDDISKVDSDKFKTIIEEVDSLHQLVKKPREQVADAEALLDITSTLVTSVRAHSNEGLTPSDFVSCLLRDFGERVGSSSSTDLGGNPVCWKDIGLAVSSVFKNASGCSTMVGPMNTEIKLRKPVVHRKYTRPTGNSARPEELEETQAEEKTDTDKNMAVMFDILRKNRKVMLERLILNRNSFAQTVENLFALSFLLKDGRAEITVNEKGDHLVSPRNAASASAVAVGEVSYSHFVFRFDFSDWKLMMARVGVGEELMPHRNVFIPTLNSQQVPASQETETALATTPIRKFCRNRGLVLQEQTVEDSPESDDSESRAAAIRKGKRKLV